MLSDLFLNPQAHWDTFDTCEHDHQLYKDFLSGNGASACKPPVNDQICPAMPQPICHVSAYKSDLTCQELVDVKAKVRPLIAPDKYLFWFVFATRTRAFRLVLCKKAPHQC